MTHIDDAESRPQCHSSIEGVPARRSELHLMMETMRKKSGYPGHQIGLAFST
jgi:hypothetical protein